MRAVDIIGKKRDGEELIREELEFLVEGYVKGEIPDYQMSAFLMAVFYRGMTFSETGMMTRVMMNSGKTFDLSEIPGIKVDKHSTGGVGDKVSLILAPLVASVGIPVPMVSGRGLGHTGGTLDKLESIPGFQTRLDQDRFIRQIHEIGVAIIGQTDDFVPADKKLYALRDVTATVASIPLISSSIVSKKVASGADAFIYDVKAGNGAFMNTPEEAHELAVALIGVTQALGCRARALVTDMNQPLGRFVGNSLEVIESIQTLKGEGPRDLTQICLELGARMLVLGETAKTLEQGRETLGQKLESGAGLEKFREMIMAQGGDPAVCDRPELLDLSTRKKDVICPRDGYIASFDTELVGICSMKLGAGRETFDASIDPGVGLFVHKMIGDRVSSGEPLYTVYYRDEKSLKEAVEGLERSVAISTKPRDALPLIIEEIGQEDNTIG